MARRAWSGGIGRLAVLTFAVFGLLAAAAPRARAQEVVGGSLLSIVRDAVFSGLANQVGTLPNPSGGGFTYQFDPGLGIFTRSTESFGPIFAERAETTGRGKVTLNASYTRHTFDAVDGVKLRTDGLFDIFAGISAGNVRLNLVTFREDVEADVFTIGGLYGVTDRLDVGLTIPIINVTVKERARRIAFVDCPPDFRLDLSNCGGVVLRDDAFRRTDAENTSVGDIVLRGKYNVWQWPEVWGGRIGVAAGLDVKVPTGDEGDRSGFVNARVVLPPGSSRVADASFTTGDPPTGTGIVRVKPQVIVSGAWAGFSPHVNVGAELGETTGITNDLVYAVGFDWTVAGKATFVFDLLGRHSFGVDRLKISRQEIVPGVSAAVVTGEEAGADTLTASIGVKVNPVGTLLVFINVLIPVNDTGVRDNVTPTFGLEWSF